MLRYPGRKSQGACECLLFQGRKRTHLQAAADLLRNVGVLAQYQKILEDKSHDQGNTRNRDNLSRPENDERRYVDENQTNRVEKHWRPMLAIAVKRSQPW